MSNQASIFEYNKIIETEITKSNTTSNKKKQKKNLKIKKENSSFSISLENPINQKIKHSKKKKSKNDSLNLSDSLFNNSPKNIKKIIEYIPDVFNSSSSENKNIIVSDLDIQIGTPNNSKPQKKKPKIIIPEDEEDFKNKLEKNIKSVLEKNKLKNNNNINNDYNYNINLTEKKNYSNQRENNNLLTHKNFLTSINNNLSLKSNLKNKSIYYQIQKTTKKNINQILKEFKDKENIKSIIKNKNLQRANSSKIKKNNNKKSLISNNSLTNCSSTCTPKGNNYSIHYQSKNKNKNKNNNNNNNKPNPKIIQPISCKNYHAHIFKTFCHETNIKDKLFINKTRKFVKKLSFNNNNGNINNNNNNNNNNEIQKKRNSIQKLKINFTQKMYESLLNDINKRKNLLNEKYKQLTSENNNKFKLFTKGLIDISKKENCFVKPEIQIFKNNMKHITIGPISSIKFKIFEKKISKEKINRRIETE